MPIPSDDTTSFRSVGATTSELQRFSGCRLHLDRESCAVRIFGPEEVVATAEKLLDNLAKACEEHLLNVKSDDLDEDQFFFGHGRTVRLKIVGEIHRCFSWVTQISNHFCVAPAMG